MNDGTEGIYSQRFDSWYFEYHQDQKIQLKRLPLTMNQVTQRSLSQYGTVPSSKFRQFNSRKF